MRHKQFPQTSMGDIAFLLLLFFLVLAITTRTVPAPLKEAESTSYETLEKEYPTIYLSSSGKLYYQDEEVTLDTLPHVPEANLMADKHLPFGTIRPVLKHLQENGVSTLHLLVEAVDAQ